MLYAGIDIGATKIAVGAVDEAGHVRRRLMASTPHGSELILDTAAHLVRELGEPAAVGVGAPGVIDAASGRVLSATDTIPGWGGVDVAGGLRTRIGAPVVVDNDVRAMAYGEATLGAAQEFQDVLFVSVGTGIGGALLRGGELLHGPHGTAGELAHLYVGRQGASRVCSCGRPDHLEAVASGPAIAARYTERAGAGPHTLQDVAELMRDGDPSALAVIRDSAELAGRALAGFVVALDVQALVVGGGVAQIGEAWLGPLREALHRDVLPVQRELPVLAARLGLDAAVAGAGLLAVRALREVAVQ